MLQRHFIISVIFVFATCSNISFAQVDYTECPKNFERGGNKCYYISANKLNWLSADAACRRLNAELLTIENEAEMNIISDYLIFRNPDLNNAINKTTKRENKWYWTSANDIDSESTWIWQSNGEVMNFKRFADGEPNNHFDEDCVHLTYNALQKHFEMNDKRCNHKLYFVCETKLSADFDLIEAEVLRLTETYYMNKKLPTMRYTID